MRTVGDPKNRSSCAISTSATVVSITGALKPNSRRTCLNRFAVGRPFGHPSIIRSSIFTLCHRSGRCSRHEPTILQFGLVTLPSLISRPLGVTPHGNSLRPFLKGDLALVDGQNRNEYAGATGSKGTPPARHDNVCSGFGPYALRPSALRLVFVVAIQSSPQANWRCSVTPFWWGIERNREFGNGVGGDWAMVPHSMLNVLMAPFQIEAISGPVDEWCLGFKVNHEFTWVAPYRSHRALTERYNALHCPAPPKE
jgi:hypothetical protein